MKVGNLVQQKPSRHQLPNEPYIGKLGIVVEQNAPARADGYDPDDVEMPITVTEMWWVQWQGNRDWDIEWEQNLKVVSE